MNKTENNPSPAFHGWKILTLATFCQFVAVGFTSYLIGLYIEPLAEAFDAKRGHLGWAAAILYIVMAMMGPFLGQLVDRGKVRVVMMIGASLLALGFVLLSYANTLWVAGLLCAFFIAPGAAMVGMVPGTAMVVQWFTRRRGFAIGVCAAGMSVGGFLMPPIAAWLISSYGWRPSFFVLGLFIAVVLIPSVWFIAVARPADLGQNPDGDRMPAPLPATAAQVASSGFRDLVVTRFFWSVALSMGMLGFCSVLLSTYLVPLGREQGLSLQVSATALSVFPAAGFIAKFLAGWLCDRFDPAKVMIGITVLASIGWLPLLYVPGFGGLALSGVLFGLAVGCMTPAVASLIASYYGPAAYGRVQGAMGPATLLLLMAPGPLGGYLYDMQGSYATVFGWLWWVLPVALVAALWIPRNTRASSLEPAVSG